MKKQRSFLYLALWLSLSIVSWGAELSISASLDRNTIGIHETVGYKVTISGKQIRNAPNPILPDMKDMFDIQGQSQKTAVSWVNGQKSISITKTYQLMPVATGNFKLAPAYIKYNDEVYQTDPLTIQVVSKNITPSPQNTPPIPSSSLLGGFGLNNGMRSTRRSQDLRTNIFLRAAASKTHVYQNEQIVYSLNLYRRIQLWSEAQYETPQFPGFWTENLTVKDQPYLEQVGSQRFYVFEVLKKALFPIEPGQIIIKPARVGFVISVFDGQQVMSSEEIGITVKPLPLIGRPEQFTGLVGDFSLTGKLNKTTSKKGEPVTYIIKVSGEGNLKNLENLLFPSASTFKIYRSKIVDELTNQGLIKGTRSFEYILRPNRVGALTIPTFTLNYFSPSDERYHTLTTEPATLTVSPAIIQQPLNIPTQIAEEKQKIELIQKDIRFIKTSLHPHDLTRSLHQRWGVFLLVFINLLALLFIMGGLLRRWLSPAASHTPKGKAAHQALKQLRQISKQKQLDVNALSQTQNILLDFLSFKTKKSLQGTTTEAIQDALKGRLTEEKVTALIDFIETLNFAAYAPTKVSIEERKASLKKAEQLILLLGRDIK